jgi:hypothetical protein
MGRSGEKDSKLSEVKAVLQRLQGFTGDGEPVGGKSARKSARRWRAGAAIAITLGTAGGVLGGALFIGLKLSDPTLFETAKLAKRQEAVTASVEVARGLMAKGQVRAAREQLLKLARHGAPDAAWDLARSYDPNVLATIPKADADPDIQEATRWYRTWYTAAVRQGLIADSVSLERIIGSMRQ